MILISHKRCVEEVSQIFIVQNQQKISNLQNKNHLVVYKQVIRLQGLQDAFLYGSGSLNRKDVHCEF
ncbi:hypothetical protein BpHYR1_009739 [Brachionus plicatilis]|uniref:Uncharacterized protein n=1 Tax=Brachionus plicatilis TaxID=10195 RepID=A0A3M7R4S1_BRAPC|nr:hypothetical protein BpHYR1_009739 [Brachionus plicatilis]